MIRVCSTPLILACLLLIFSSIGCQTDDLNSNLYRLTGRTVTVTNWSLPGTSEDVWHYKGGRLLAYRSPGSVGTYPAQVEYGYDGNGYLVAERNEQTLSGVVGFVGNVGQVSYVYEKGRLSKELRGTWVAVQYEYDRAGHLVRVTYPGPGGPATDSHADTYADGKLVRRVTRYAGSTTDTDPYDIEQGRIVRHYARDRRYSTAYAYDAQGRPTQIDEMDGSTVRQRYTYAYTEGKAHFEAVPLPKGWPDITRRKFVYAQLLSGSPVLPVGLPVRQVRYLRDDAGTGELYQNMVTTYAYTLNEQGYPVRCESTIEVFDPSGTLFQKTKPTIETYSYAGKP
jgi:YD repeat-containing protein